GRGCGVLVGVKRGALAIFLGLAGVEAAVAADASVDVDAHAVVVLPWVVALRLRPRARGRLRGVRGAQGREGPRGGDEEDAPLEGIGSGWVMVRDSGRARSV